MEEKCDSLMANYTEHLYGKYNRNILQDFKGFNRVKVNVHILLNLNKRDNVQRY